MAEKKGYNRRDFLKIVGASTGVAAAGCAQELPEKLIPYVVQPDDIIPGVASWYAGSCDECAAGCGTLTRVREGRAVKVEGNPSHPINQGGLCAIGQSTVQGLYDPDRVREPLERTVNGAFKPITWEQAIQKIARAISVAGKAKKQSVLLTAPLGGSQKALVAEYSKNVAGTRHISYEMLGRDVIDSAAAQSFGAGFQQHFDLSKAGTIVSFGADYLETWLSPVANTKGFSKGRKPDSKGTISTVFQVEPRLSLTAANADHWYANAPGTERQILLALLTEIVKGDSGKGLPSAAKAQAASAVSDAKVETLLDGTGISTERLKKMAKALVQAKHSLVLSGGAATSGAQAKSCAMIANLLNYVLGNIGHTVLLYRDGSSPSEQTSHQQLLALSEEMASGDSTIAVAMLSGVNPVYTLPSSSGFAKALSTVGLVVSHSTHLDETAQLAHIVLPKSTSFESWSDSEPRPGVFNLNQPAMQPLYKSQSLGDLLITIAAQEDVAAPIAEVESFYDYIRAQWKKRTGATGFEDRWLGYVEQGGDWAAQKAPVVSVSLQSSATALPEVGKTAGSGLAVLAYPTVLLGDGASANRPWMQEVPDPMTTAVWGSWIEIHPDTAAANSLKHGDVAQLKTSDGFVEAPVYVTKHIHKDVLGLPLGQGHESLGRFANGVGVNAVNLLATASEQDSQLLLAFGATLSNSVARDELVTTQGHDSQEGRGLLRTISSAELAKKLDKKKSNGHDDHGDAHAGGHHDPFALGPQEVPRQMYKQMEHPQYRWGMSVDLNNCTGCAACVTACYAENNIPVVGKDLVAQRREMSWIRIDRYIDGPDDSPVTGFSPMMCQHCGNAPCEPVCPVYATYHSDEGLNTMVYNRCVGTRYCSNNCSYKVRRFNWFKYEWPEPLNWQLNPDVTVRSLGVMEKCSFCIQRIREVENKAKDLGRPVQDGEVQPACASSCPADAITFGNLLDHDSKVYEDSQSERSYKMLDFQLNTQPGVLYLAKVTKDGQGSGSDHGAVGDSPAGQAEGHQSEASHSGAEGDSKQNAAQSDSAHSSDAGH